LDYESIALPLAHVILGVVVLILAKYALQLLSPYALDEEMTTKDNPAFGLAVSGYYAGVVLIYIAAAAAAGPLPAESGPRGVVVALASDLAYALCGVLALNASRWVFDRVLVSHVRNDTEIATNRNTGAGALECGAYLASAIVLGGAIRQPGANVWVAAALFVLGLIALLLTGRLYQWLAGYDLAGEIRSGNLAAGVAFGMTLCALALLMVRAVAGEYVSWIRNLTWFAIDALIGLLLLLVLRWVTDAALLPHARIADEIARDRNVNVGLIEGVLAVGIAAIILYLF